MANKAIVNNQFRIYTAQKFIEALLETQLSNNNLFLWVGKVIEWATEADPDQPHDTVTGRIGSFADMIAIKKVSPSDASLVLPRYDWTATTVYAQYSNLGILVGSIRYDQYEPLTASAPFFVMNSVRNVYKCLWNNSGGASSNEPTGTSTSPFTTADGYIWKYMYTISSSEAQRFLTDDWMPVRAIIANDGSNQWSVQQTAIAGQIEKVIVTAPGTLYTTAPTVTVLTGDGTGFAATATVGSGAVTGITVTNKGTGYTFMTLGLSGGGGSGATTLAIISPPGGHGSDAVAELGAMYVIVNVKLQFTESGKMTVDNDFRKFGLLLNPLRYGTSSLYTSLFGTLTTNITLVDVVGTYEADEIVEGADSEATGVVVDFDAGTGVLRLTSVLGTFEVGEIIEGADSEAVGEVDEIANPDIKANSGMILVTEHAEPTVRADDQSEDFKIVLTL